MLLIENKASSFPARVIIFCLFKVVKSSAMRCPCGLQIRAQSVEAVVFSRNSRIQLNITATTLLGESGMLKMVSVISYDSFVELLMIKLPYSIFE